MINYGKWLFISKFIWKKPQHKKILIYDRNGLLFFLKYFKKKHLSILDIRMESINVPIIFFTFFNSGLKNLFVNYSLNYIQAVNPVVILTMTDTDLRFYQLKDKLNISPKFIAIQNGLIGARNFFKNSASEIIKKKLKLSCDYFFCANKNIIKNYSKIIKADFFPIGSFKNNTISIKKKKSNFILFISQFSSPKNNLNDIFFKDKNIQVTYKHFYADDISILKKLNIFCQKKKIKLFIKLRDSNSSQEKEFYYKNLKFNNINFKKTENNVKDYQILDAAKVVVFLDSFLGYEAFARGNKVAAFPIRGKTLKLSNSNFADNELPRHGFFWTNANSQKKLNLIMNNVLTLSNSKWVLIKKKLENNIILYDKNNKTFIELIKKIIVNKTKYENAINKPLLNGNLFLP